MAHKILYLTDSHFRESRPRGRKDDFLQSLIEKHREIAELSHKVKPTVIVHGGDLFDAPKQSIYLYQIVKKIIMECYDSRWHVVLGNHEWRGRWEDWRERSALHALEEDGLIKLHEGHLHLTIDGYEIISRHEQYVEKPVLWGHTLWKNYDGPANVFLVSDYHPFQGAKKVGNTVFIAPGAISRGTRTESDLTRTPKVAIITLGKSISAKFYDLKCAKPASEVFTEEIAKVTKDKADFQSAIDSLKALGDEIKLYSVEDVIKVVAATTKATERVMNICLDRLSETSSKS